MSANSRITNAYENAFCLPLNPSSKYVLFSDCHRGTGRSNDNFLKNEYLYLAALKYYFSHGFTYIELGDGDELWENRSMCPIREMHAQSFELLSRFYAKHRFYAVYGNHDITKRSTHFSGRCFSSCFCWQEQCEIPLFPEITFYPGIILKDCAKRKDLFLLHGHQSDLLNSTLWRLSRFLVRYVWRPLESLGIPDPTSAAKNHTKKNATEKKLSAWAKQHELILIAGHTHRPVIGNRTSPYCNTGSCVSPAGITAIEIENRCMTLIKWSQGTRSDMCLQVLREPLGSSLCIDDFL